MRFVFGVSPLELCYLDTACEGIVLNGALQAEAGKFAFNTAAQYMRDPQSYDPEKAWGKALLEVCGDSEDAEAVKALADLARRSPLLPGHEHKTVWRPVLEGFWQNPSAEAAKDLRARLRRLLEDARRPQHFKNSALARDLRPWSTKLGGWAKVGLMGLAALQSPSEARITDLLEEIYRVRENFAWVGGDLFELFARRCAAQSCC